MSKYLVNELPFELPPMKRGKAGLHYRLFPSSPLTDGDLNRLAWESDDTGVGLIKSNSRTRVVRFSVEGIWLIVKLYSMNRFKDSLRHKRYGFSEYSNNLIAAYRGIPVPKCYAYFEKRKWGLVKYCGVVMQALDGFMELKELMQTKKADVFDAICIIKFLYERGINHIDLSPANIFMRPEDRQFSIIDWQYCSFIEPHNDLQLCLAASVFLSYTGLKQSDPTWSVWIKRLLNECCSGVDFNKMQDAICIIINNERVHWKDRLNLDVKGLGIEAIW